MMLMSEFTQLQTVSPRNVAVRLLSPLQHVTTVRTLSYGVLLLLALNGCGGPLLPIRRVHAAEPVPVL